MSGSGIYPISIGRSADATTGSPRTCVPAEVSQSATANRESVLGTCRRRHRAGRDQSLEHCHGAALPGFGIRIEAAVGNVATLCILVGARPDIRRMDAMLPVAQAVVAFPGDEHPGNAPIVPLVVTIDRDGIHRTLFPAERRPATGASLRPA